MKNYFDIKDKVAVITGGSSGLGFQIGKAYADQCAKVVLLARREERLKENVEEIKETYGVEASYEVVDVTDYANVEAAAKNIIDKFGRVDILVNCAGRGYMSPVIEQPVEEDDSIDILDNSEIINENSYASSDETNDKPYVIPPEEFGEMEGYVQSSLTYYADRVLTDEDDNVIDDVDGIVGADFYKHFGEYEEDSVFVRNDGKKHDYEILKL